MARAFLGLMVVAMLGGVRVDCHAANRVDRAFCRRMMVVVM